MRGFPPRPPKKLRCYKCGSYSIRREHLLQRDEADLLSSWEYRCPRCGELNVISKETR